MPPNDAKPLRERLGGTSGRFLVGFNASISFSDLARCTSFGGHLSELRRRSVLITARDQLATALALVELDGISRRLAICPPDLSSKQLTWVCESAGIDAIVSDYEAPIEHENSCERWHIDCCAGMKPVDHMPVGHERSEWLLLTSGTTGAPKILAHDLQSLTASTKVDNYSERPVVWGCFYDIRRFAGLQVFLQATLGGGSLVLAGGDESLEGYLARLIAHSATHISGTPSQWRRVLMSPLAKRLAPRQLTLGGEIVDQAILDGLRSFYPNSRITHIYASTEAGVGFAVNDGLEGFPASMVGSRRGGVEAEVEDGSLRLRSGRAANRCVGGDGSAVQDEGGFVDTGDSVALRGDRYYFLGRRTGAINVGGLKVYPEEVEAVINRHPKVRMSRVRSRKNPMTGNIVVAEVVLIGDHSQTTTIRTAELEGEILQICRKALAQHKCPATIRFVPSLDVAPTGKLARHHA